MTDHGAILAQESREAQGLLTLSTALQQLEGRAVLQLPTIGDTISPRKLFNTLSQRDPDALGTFVQLHPHRLAWWHPDRPSVGGWGITWLDTCRVSGDRHDVGECPHCGTWTEEA